jgi:hypothetical protein
MKKYFKIIFTARVTLDATCDPLGNWYSKPMVLNPGKDYYRSNTNHTLSKKMMISLPQNKMINGISSYNRGYLSPSGKHWIIHTDIFIHGRLAGSIRDKIRF